MKHTNLNESNIYRVNIAEVGNRWQVKGDRLYLSNEFKLKALGLEVETYKGGAVSHAKQHGETISNTKATKLIDGCRRAWVDLETGELMDVTRTEAEELLVPAINALVFEDFWAGRIPEDAEVLFETSRIKIFYVNGIYYARFIDMYGVPHDRSVSISHIDRPSDETRTDDEMIREYPWPYYMAERYDENGKVFNKVITPRESFYVHFWFVDDDPEMDQQREQARQWFLDRYAEVFDEAERRGKAEGKDTLEYWLEDQKKHFRPGNYEANGCLIHVNFVTHFCGSVEVDYDNYATAYANFSCKAKVEVVDGVDQIVERGHIIRATDRLSDEEVERRLAARK